MKVVALFVIFIGVLALAKGAVLPAIEYMDPEHMESPQWSNCRHLSQCVEIYEPLCGIDEQGVPKSFSNPCQMGYYNCMEGTYYVKVKKGVC